MIGLGLSVVQIAVRQLLGFDPKSLFAASEQGVWYDPSDFSTMFQDSAGATPVTAVEQPVGLILDKSRGLVLGPELVVNGTFDTDTGWTKGTGWTISGGSANLDSSVSGAGVVTALTQNIATVAGRAYRVTFNITSSNLQTNELRFSFGGSTVADLVGVTQGSYIVFASGATSAVTFTTLGGIDGNETAALDNISVRELPGNHATQTTSTSRPVLSARVNLLTKTEQFDDAVWTKSGATVTANTTATIDPLGGNTADLLYPSSTGSNRFIYQVLAVNAALTRSVYAKAAGKSVFYIDLTGAGTQHAFFDLSNGTVGSVQSGYTASIESVGNGWYKCSVSNATAISSSFGGIYGVADANGSTAVTANGTEGIYIWGASLVPSNQAALPYQRVNTSTDYDATGFPLYLKFDGVDDFLVTNSINFTATDKMTVFAGVRKLSDAVIGMVTELSAQFDSNSGTFALYNFTNAGLYWASRGTATSNPNATPLVSPTTLVVTAQGNISGDSAILRVNGTQAAFSTADQGTGNFGNYPLYIGRRGGTTMPFNGHLYSLIVRGAQSSAGQIASAETWVNSKTGAY